MTFGNAWPYTAADVNRFRSKVDLSDGCWMWTGTTSPKGYGLISIGPRAQCRQVRAHRMAWEIANEQRVPDGLVVRHHCDTPGCVRPDHLAVGTTADNNRDILERGRGATGDRNGSRKHRERVPRGERQHLAKLTDHLVREARRRYSEGTADLPTLAAEAGVHVSTMHAAVQGDTWAHVTNHEVVQ